MQKCTQKDNNKKNSGIWQLFLRTMRTMGKRRFMYYGSILGMSITFAMFSVMEAFLMKIVVDIAQKGEWDRLISSVVIIVITGVIVLLGYRFACIRYNVEAKRIYGKLYEQVLSHEMKLPCEYYENHHSGEMLSKVSFDLGRMGDIWFKIQKSCYAIYDGSCILSAYVCTQLAAYTLSCGCKYSADRSYDGSDWTA